MFLYPLFDLLELMLEKRFHREGDYQKIVYYFLFLIQVGSST